MITRVNVNILVPAVVAVALVGVYALKGEFGDVVLAMVFGVIGFLMIRWISANYIGNRAGARGTSRAKLPSIDCYGRRRLDDFLYAGDFPSAVYHYSLMSCVAGLRFAFGRRTFKRGKS